MTLDHLREYIDWLSEHKPLHVAGYWYCVNLCMLANGMGAKRVLELGQGWGWSSTAFATALRGRSGAHIDSVDFSSPPRLLSECADYIKASDISYASHNCAALDFKPTGEPYDLVYIDLNQDAESTQISMDYAYKHLLPTGPVIIDGYGGEDGCTRVAARHGMLPLFYCDTYAHAISVPRAAQL